MSKPVKSEGFPKHLFGIPVLRDAMRLNSDPASGLFGSCDVLSVPFARMLSQEEAEGKGKGRDGDSGIIDIGGSPRRVSTLRGNPFSFAASVCWRLQSRFHIFIARPSAALPSTERVRDRAAEGHEEEGVRLLDRK